MKRPFLPALVFACVAGPSGAAIIDAFDVSQYVGTPSQIDSFSEAEDDGVIGSYRDLHALNPGDLDANIAFGEVKNGQFLFDVTDSAAVQITWDGQDNSSIVDTDGLGGIDLTDGGKSDEFAFAVVSIFGAVEYAFSVWDSDGDSAKVFGFLDSTGEEEIAFSEFGSAVDFTRVGAIGLELINSLDRRATSTVTIDDVKTQPAAVIPLPAALPMLLGGLGALGIVGRMRRKS